MKTKLKKRIQELVPDIMRLEFGCEIKSYCHPDTDIVIDDEGEIDGLVGGKYATHEKKNIKILGRPITLADVLMAITVAPDVKTIYAFSTPAICPTNDVQFMLFKWVEGKFESLGVYWIAKETLDGQSEETLRALSDILIGKE